MPLSCVVIAGLFWLQTANHDLIAVDHISAVEYHSFSTSFVVAADRRLFVPHSVTRVRRALNSCRQG